MNLKSDMHLQHNLPQCTCSLFWQNVISSVNIYIYVYIYIMRCVNVEWQNEKINMNKMQKGNKLIYWNLFCVCSFCHNFLRNCCAGPNNTWYPFCCLAIVSAVDMVGCWATLSSPVQMAFVRWKELPLVQIVSRIIAMLCDNNLEPFELIWATMA